MPQDLRVLDVLFNQGMVTSRPKEALEEGECPRLVGVYYKPGDTVRPWKRPGRRQEAYAGADLPVKGLAYLGFDAGGVDRLIAYIGGKLMTRNPLTPGSAFTEYSSAFTTEGLGLTAIQYGDRWYLGNGLDRNLRISRNPRILLTGSTDEPMGMRAPTTAPVVTASSVATGSASYPTSSTNGGATNPEFVYDSALDGQFATLTLSAPGTVTCKWHGWAASAAAGRNLVAKFQLTGSQVDYGGDPRDAGPGATADAGFRVNVLLEVSQDSGVTFKTMYNGQAIRSAFQGPRLMETSLTGNSSAVQLRATMTYVSGVNPASLRVYRGTDIQSGPASAAFTPDVGFYYFYVEHDDVENLSSPPSPASILLTGPSPPTLGLMNRVSAVCQFPTINPTTTSLWLYRTTDGGSGIQSACFVKSAPVVVFAGDTAVDNAVVIDDFVIDKDTQTTDLIHFDETRSPNGGTIRIPRDSPPPAFFHMNEWQGRVIGLSRTNPRAIYASAKGLPESWPENSIITDFDIPEHEVMLSTATVGEPLIIGLSEVIMVLSSWPEAVNGRFNGAEAHPLGGQPGLVSEQGMCSYSISGEPRAAWVSRFGVHWTNGSIADKLTKDLDWPALVYSQGLSTAVLRYVPYLESLLLCFDGDGGGANSLWMLLHMAEEHRKPNGMPKLTLGYGALACLAYGQVNGVPYLWSGHTSNGSVYLEDTGGIDEGGAYQGNVLPMFLTSRKFDLRGRKVAVVRGRIRHSDFGDAESGEVVWSVTDELTQAIVSVPPQSVSLTGNGASAFGIARAGDLHEMTFEHTGQGLGAVDRVEVFARPMGQR